VIYIVDFMNTSRLLLLTTLPLLFGPSLPAQPAPPPSASGTSAMSAALLQAAPTIRPEALMAALSAWETLSSEGELCRPILTVIDYGLSSMTKRMWVFDLDSRRLLFHELVAHGRNSGDDLTQSFSNEEGSLMSSLGAFVTGTTYNGKNGYSLRLRGMDPGLNDHAEQRAIVMHGAPYVSDEVAQKLGRLGRSLGCPAIRPEIARSLIDEIRDGTLLYAWHPSLGQAEPAVDALTAARVPPDR